MLSLDEQVDVLLSVPAKGLRAPACEFYIERAFTPSSAAWLPFPSHPPTIDILQVAANVEVGIRDARGRELPAVVAAKSLASGSLIFREAPLVGSQLLENLGYALVCSRCFTFIGSVERQLANAGDHLDGCIGATKEPDARPLVAPLPDLPKSQDFPLPDVHLCSGWPACSDAVYCSEECRAAAWDEGHSLLCLSHSVVHNGLTTPTQERYPLMEAFRDHTGLSSDTFKLGAQAVAWVLQAARKDLEKDGLELNNAEAVWEALQRVWAPFCVGEAWPDWWDVAPAPPGDTPPSDDMRLRAEARELALDALKLLRAALEARAPELVAAFPAALHPRTWAGLLGTLETRKLLLTVASPLPAWARAIQSNMESLSEEEKVSLAGNRALNGYGGIEGLGTGDDEWMCVGMGFYPLQALVRHSCVPNATTAKADDDDTGDAVLLALRTIRNGEEVTLSYVDNNASLEERTQELADRYGITCYCDKCGVERLARSLSER